MQVESNIRLTLGSYYVQVSLAPGDALSGRERDAMAAFGQPVVEFGGSFSGDDVSFTLPADPRAVPGQLPCQKQFSLVDYGSEANAYAVLYETTMLTRLRQALGALLERDAGVTGRTISNLRSQDPPVEISNAAQLSDWMNL